MKCLPHAAHRILTTAASLAVVAAAATVAVLAGAEPAAAARIPVACADNSSDAAAIQAAINSSAEGDEIVIDGPCTITSTVTLRGNRAYRGESASTVLRQADGRNLAAVLASDSWGNNDPFTGDPITLRDLTINANADNNPTGGDAVVIRSRTSTSTTRRPTAYASLTPHATARRSPTLRSTAACGTSSSKAPGRTVSTSKTAATR
jgi:hypothetical protein